MKDSKVRDYSMPYLPPPRNDKSRFSSEYLIGLNNEKHIVSQSNEYKISKIKGNNLD